MTDAPKSGHAVVPFDPTPDMIQAYRLALRNYIRGFTEAERAARWGKPGKNGYRVPEWEKAAARYRAMIDAAPARSDGLGGTQEEVCRELCEFSDSAKVLSAQYEQLAKEHPQKWVGVYQGKIAGLAKTFDALTVLLRNNGAPLNRTMVRYLREPG